MEDVFWTYQSWVVLRCFRLGPSGSRWCFSGLRSPPTSPVLGGGRVDSAEKEKVELTSDIWRSGSKPSFLGMSQPTYLLSCLFERLELGFDPWPYIELFTVNFWALLTPGRIWGWEFSWGCGSFISFPCLGLQISCSDGFRERTSWIVWFLVQCDLFGVMEGPAVTGTQPGRLQRKMRKIEKGKVKKKADL